MGVEEKRTFQDDVAADVVLFNGRIATQDDRRSMANAVAIRGDRFVAVGNDSEALEYKGSKTRTIDLKGRTAIPGLNDSHTHVIRAGLSYSAELHWDGLASLQAGIQMIREQSRRVPPQYWIKVVGGWSEFQFREKRGPTTEELNQSAPNSPVFVLHLYHDALLNKKALEAAAISRDTPDPPGGEIQRDAEGNPTGTLVARPNATILYSTLAKSPRLPYEEQRNSTRLFLRELNSLGITSIIDAGGGYQNYPNDYAVVSQLARDDILTVRVAYNLFTQRPKHEFEDFASWSSALKPGTGSSFYRLNGAGEMLVYSGADFENFPEARPDLPPSMEEDLGRVVSLLVDRRWPFRLHATYDESISRFLDVFEAVNERQPFDGLRWFFDHAETISSKNIRRVKLLGGGIAVQDRLAFQGEHFLERYGEDITRRSPPIKEIVDVGVPIGAGTDATRVSSYNPWIALYWLVSGKTIGGTELYPESYRLNRMEALRLWTYGGGWFSGEQQDKGSVEVGRLADMAVLSCDYFTVPEEDIRAIRSVLTIVGGKVVYASDEFANLTPPGSPPQTPPWSALPAH